jgi:hypothetical protein
MILSKLKENVKTDIKTDIKTVLNEKKKINDTNT